MLEYCILWVQVVSEMLPISSSTHVDLAQKWYEYFCGNMLVAIPHGFTYFLHVPILLVIPLFFAQSWWPLVSILAQRLWLRQRLGTWSTKQLLVIVSKVIVIVLSCNLLAFSVDEILKKIGYNPLWQSAGLCLTALLLFFASSIKNKPFKQKITPLTTLWLVGIVQVIALLPGISRMGATICVGLLCGMQLRRAFEFSFALQYPLVLGAVLLRGVPWLCSTQAIAWIGYGIVINLIFAGIFSYWVLKYAVYLFATRRTWILGWYVLLCAAILALI